MDRARANLENAAQASEQEYDSVSNQITRLEQELASVQQRIPPLFELVSDVKLADVPAVFNSLNIRIAPNDELCKALCQSATSIERLVYFATFAALGKVTENTISFHIPLPTPDGKVLSTNVKVSPADLIELGKNPARLANVLSAFKAVRDAIEATYRATTTVQDLASGEREKMKSALQEPIAPIKSGRLALVHLLRHDNPTVSLAAVRLLDTPAFESVKSEIAQPVLEFPRSFDLLSIVTAQFLAAKDGRAEKLQSVFASQPHFQEALGVMCNARNLLAESNMVGFATFMNEQLLLQKKALEGAEPLERFKALGILSILHGLTSNDSIVRELRFQIPDLSVTKQLGKALIGEHLETQNLILDSVHDIMCAFSQSLRDYYMADKAGHLKEAIDMYRYFLRNPHIAQGIPANHVLKNAVAVYGPPGVGKSFFAMCVSNELDDIVLVTLSPGDKKPDEDPLGYVKRIFDEVKRIAAKSPVLLLIDEAETTVFHRMHPLASPTDRERTNYILTALDEIRKSYPNVFTLMASNYPERVDEAMERHGRIDLVVYLGNPTPLERQAIIEETIRKENVPLTLTADQKERIVEITDGFIPIQIIQAITGTHRLYIPFMRDTKRDPDLEWSFQLLVDRFQRMVDEDKVRKEKKNVMSKTPAMTSMLPTDASQS